MTGRNTRPPSEWDGEERRAKPRRSDDDAIEKLEGIVANMPQFTYLRKLEIGTENIL